MAVFSQRTVSFECCSSLIFIFRLFKVMALPTPEQSDTQLNIDRRRAAFVDDVQAYSRSGN